MGSTEFRTLAELFVKAVEEHPKPDAFIAKSGREYRGVSSDEALHQVAGLAQGLERLGVERGDRVAILSENRLEWAITDFAVLGLGAIDVPIYPTLLDPDIEYILRDSGAKGVVASSSAQVKKVRAGLSRLPDLRFILSMDRVEFSGSHAQHWHRIVKDSLLSSSDPVPDFRKKCLEVRPEDAATLL